MDNLHPFVKKIIIFFIYIIYGLIFLLEIIISFFILLFNFFFFLILSLVFFFFLALNSFFYSAFLLYIYLYLISPLLYIMLYLLGYFSKFLPILFIYFLMCYNTIYVPGYKTFYFFGHSLWYWKWYLAYYVKLNLLKNHYAYYLHFIFLFIYFIFIFGEFNLISFFFLFYVNYLIYYYIFLVFKFLGNILSLISLFIINIIFLKNLMLLTFLNNTEINASDTLWEMFNYRLNYRLSTLRYHRKWQLDRLFIDFVKRKDLNLKKNLEEEYNKWFKLRNSRLDTFSFESDLSYWVRNKRLLKLLNLNFKEEAEDLLSRLEILDNLKKDGEYNDYKFFFENELVSSDPIQKGWKIDSNLDSKIKNLTSNNFDLYRKILQDEMGTDIFYLPTAKERKPLEDIINSPIYRYNLEFNSIPNNIEDDYVNKELEKLDQEYLEKKKNKKKNFNFFDSLLDYIDITLLKKKNNKVDLSNKYIDLYFNENKEDHLENFIVKYSNNKNLYNNGEVLSYNEHFIYLELKKFDEIDFEYEFFDPYINFERDLSVSESLNLSRLYDIIKLTTLNDIENIPYKDLEFKHFDLQDNIIYNKAESTIEKLKIINEKWIEDPELKEFLSLESQKIKLNNSRNRHVFRFYDDDRVSYKYNSYDLKLIRKYDEYTRYYGVQEPS